MPYRKKNYRKYYPRKKSTVPKKVKKYVKSEIMRAEKAVGLHTYVSNAVAGSISTTPVFYPLTNNTQIPKGTDDYTRIGDRFAITSIKGKMVVTAGDNTNYVRLVLFSLVEPAFVPGVDDLFWNIGASNDYWRQHINRTNNGIMFNIILDKTFNVEAETESTVMYEWKKTWKNGHVVQYTSYNTATPKGSVYALLVSDSGVAAHPTVKQDIVIEFLP